jgi:hypothetical protein
LKGVLVARDINRQIEQRIQAFAEELNQLVRQAALEAVQDALGGRSVSRAAPVDRAPSRRGRATRRTGGRRSSQQMSGMMTALRDYVAQNPGARMEHISSALGRSTIELRLPVKKLLDAGVIRKEGEKRATEYFPGGGAGQPAKSKRAGTKKKRGRKKKTSKRSRR